MMRAVSSPGWSDSELDWPWCLAGDPSASLGMAWVLWCRPAGGCDFIGACSPRLVTVLSAWPAGGAVFDRSEQKAAGFRMTKTTVNVTELLADAPVLAVFGGVDTHARVHVAAAVDQLGRVLGTKSFPASAAGYQALRCWLVGFGTLVAVGVEGTGSYGAGLARALAEAGIMMVEVDRPDRSARRRGGKDLRLAAPEQLREELAGLKLPALARTVTAWTLPAPACPARAGARPGPRPLDQLADPTTATRIALHTLGHRIAELDVEIAALDTDLEGLSGPPARHRAHPGLQRHHHPPPAAPRRRPARQLRRLPHRRGPSVPPRPHPGVRHHPDRPGQDQIHDHPQPQTLPRPRNLPSPHDRSQRSRKHPINRLTSIGASPATSESPRMSLVSSSRRTAAVSRPACRWAPARRRPGS